MKRTSLVFALIALAITQVSTIAQEDAEKAPVGAFDLKSDDLSAKVHMFRQGQQVGFEFSVSSPFQPDTAGTSLSITVGREDEDLRGFIYYPAKKDRRYTSVRSKKVWKADESMQDAMSAVITDETKRSWRGVVWIDTEKLGADTTETWKVSVSVRVEGGFAAYPKDPQGRGILEEVDLADIEERATEGQPAAAEARKSEDRALAVLEEARWIVQVDPKITALVAGLKDDPLDGGLNAELLKAVKQVGDRWSDEDKEHSRTALQSSLKACPGWYSGHSAMIDLVMFQGNDKQAADYFKLWYGELPKSSARGWADLFGSGRVALTRMKQWKELAGILGVLTEEDYQTDRMAEHLKSIGRSLLYAGHAKEARSVRDALVSHNEKQEGTLSVWWLSVLVDAGRFQDAYAEAQALLSVDGVVTTTGFPRTAALAISGCFDPPEAAEACEKFIKELKAALPEGAELPGLGTLSIESYAEVCRNADKDWQEELGYRKVDAEKQNPRVRIQTDQGEFVVELFEDDAPNTVANFVKLVQDGFYSDRQIYRREKSWMVQGGSKDDSPTSKEDWSIKNEQNRRHHWRGTVAMARRGISPDSADTAFFITVGNSPEGLKLGTDWVVFGRIVEGLPNAQRLQEGDKIVKATAENLRDHEYEPERIPAEDK